ncbi:DNA recombinase [Exiguobacterium sp. SH4S7]|uniref:JAB domain-containing protein n=1 Tax=Exiguobacterium sp. SH4S7 TaxID=2510958 RepID=UPI00103E6838|nr:JAB domain-containing protein [Exiguobacterium sp. SH4S7]TCI33825.1 DNA recombinase [Exiguobacterium sp. SH4S7]
MCFATQTWNNRQGGSCFVARHGLSAIIHSPDRSRQIEASFIGNDASEVFLVIMLNTENRVIDVNSSVVHPGKVFKCATLKNASSHIICYQNPSGT